MICDRCGKNQANIHMKNIFNGKITEYHICEQCAKSGENLETEGNFFLEVLMTGMINEGVGNSSERASEEKVCRSCGTTYSEFREAGSIGCEYCYDSFRHEIRGFLKRISGDAKHRGKIPNRIGGTMKKNLKIGRLKREMNIAVDEERFEDAAEYRDRIKELELETSKEE